MLAQAMAGRNPAELQGVLNSLLAAGPPAGGPLAAGPLTGGLLERPAPPSRRRPRRAETVAYQVRVDLKGTKPPLWRRLELASDLSLDQVHDIIQLAFGWTDSHLHGFASGPGFYSDETEHYLCPFDVEEGETGIPEGQVRLDEVLAEPGDKLLYGYDYGDDWQHVIALEAVLPVAAGSPRAVCTGGRRAGPAEDCGGVYAYELIQAATDPANPDFTDAVAEFARVFGDVDIAATTGTPFDIDEINGSLLQLASGGEAAVSDLPGPLADLVSAVRSAAERKLLLRLIGAGGLDQPVLIDAATAARMVRPYAWLLDRVGDDGIKLTGAGYLPPAYVEAATAELGLSSEWIGNGNRESQTLPVLALRETAQRLGLLRKHSGRLLLSPRGRAVRADPVALWWHLAERMPPRSTDVCERQAGLLLLVLLAAEAADHPEATIARLLAAIGWMLADDRPLTADSVARAAWDTKAVLRRIGAFAEGPDGSYGRDEPTKDGVTFARAALQRWPAISGRAASR